MMLRLLTISLLLGTTIPLDAKDKKKDSLGKKILVATGIAGAVGACYALWHTYEHSDPVSDKLAPDVIIGRWRESSLDPLAPSWWTAEDLRKNQDEVRRSLLKDLRRKKLKDHTGKKITSLEELQKVLDREYNHIISLQKAARTTTFITSIVNWICNNPPQITDPHEAALNRLSERLLALQHILARATCQSAALDS